MELVILFGGFTLLMLLGVPIAFTLGLSALGTVLYMDLPVLVVFQRMAAGMNGFSLLAIPFFIFAGELMHHGGIAERLIRLADAAVGHLKGGLGQVNVLACMLFGGLSGSAVADASAIGGIMIPKMRERGYDADYAVNVTASSAILDIMIPPSHNMILYSIAAGGTVSITALFLAGIVPGVFGGILLMLAAYGVAVWRGYPSGEFPGWRLLLVTFAHAVPGLMTAVIIIVGLRFGLFTSTESSAIAVIYAAAVTALYYRSLDLATFVKAATGAARTTAMVLLVIGAASAFGWVMALLEAPAATSRWVTWFGTDPIVILLMVNVILLLIGTFMDMAPMIMICTPIFLPIVQAAGMDPVQFGMLMMLNLGIGLLTPPVGTVLFVGCAIAGIRMEDTLATSWPFYLALLGQLALVTYWPAFTLWLPRVLGA